MKKSSLESINKHLKQATDVSIRNKDLFSYTGRRSTGKTTGGLTSTSQKKTFFDRIGKDSSNDSISSRNSLKKSQKPSIGKPVIQLNDLSKSALPSQMIPQSSYTYVSSKNKATVNIFNFNNYNVIRNEKEKFKKERKPDHSQDHSFKSSDNLQNFFIFSRPNRDSVKKPQATQPSSTKGSQILKLDLSFQHSSKRNEPVPNQNHRVIKHQKSGSMNLGQSQKSLPHVTGIPHRSFRSGASFASIELGGEKAFKTTRPSSGSEMNDFIQFVQSENKFSKWMNSVKLAHKQRKNMALTLHPLHSRKSSLSVPMIEDPLEKTRDLVCSLITDLKTVDIERVKPSLVTKNNSTQTEEKITLKEEPVITSQNYNALIRETASLFLSQSKRFKEGNGDAEHFFKKIATKPWIDEQSLLVFNRSISTLQEHLIFEEALRILQEKGVILENIFAFVYEKFGINAGKDKTSSPEPLDPNDEDISGASFEDEEPLQLKKTNSKNQEGIRLDFSLLRADSEPSCQSGSQPG